MNRTFGDEEGQEEEEQEEGLTHYYVYNLSLCKSGPTLYNRGYLHCC